MFQKLATEALQDLRIQHRWEAIEQENNLLVEAKLRKQNPGIEIFENGATRKQLLARSRYLLYKTRESGLNLKKRGQKYYFMSILI